jgi:DNA-binding transcriptional LysR family regulator
MTLLTLSLEQSGEKSKTVIYAHCQVVAAGRLRPTLDGEAYYRCCLGILKEVEDAEGAFKDVKPKGTLLVQVQGTLARHFLMPSLFEFFARYPEIELSMSESDRWVDLVREGVDCMLRFGNLPDSDMVARRVGMLSGMTCAAPWSGVTSVPA